MPPPLLELLSIASTIDAFGWSLDPFPAHFDHPARGTEPARMAKVEVWTVVARFGPILVYYRNVKHC
jgi:hypothetical protein